MNEYTFEFMGDYGFRSKKTFKANNEESACKKAQQQLESFQSITLEKLDYKQL